MTKQAETHAIELRAYEATVQNLEQRIRELEALMVPGRFPSDVMTAAGLVYHGKRDKVLAERLRIGAQSMLAALAEAAQVPVMGDAVAWTSPEWLKEKGRLHGMTRPHPSFKLPLYRAPTTCITQAELDALRKSERTAMKEASDIAMAMWRDFFQEASPNFGLCDSPAGVLSQIDNMYAGLRERIQFQDARIRELEIAIQEIIEQNHYDFRGHEIAEAAIAKERQS